MSTKPLDFSDLGDVPISPKPSGKLDFSDLGDTTQQQAAPQSAIGQLFDSSKPLADRFRTADIALSKTGVNLAKGAIKKFAEPAATLAGGLNKLPWIGELLAPSQGVSAFKQSVQPSNTAQTVGGIGEQAGEMAVTGAPLRAGAEALATKLPFLAKYFAPVARIGAEALNTGMSATAHGQPIGTSAGIGAAGGALGEAASAAAAPIQGVLGAGSGAPSGLVTKMLMRGLTRTGAGALAGALGYSQGGAKGAALGAGAAAILSTPAGQMALARLLKAGLPELLARGLVSSGFGQEVQPTAP